MRAGRQLARPSTGISPVRSPARSTRRISSVSNRSLPEAARARRSARPRRGRIAFMPCVSETLQAEQRRAGASANAAVASLRATGAVVAARPRRASSRRRSPDRRARRPARPRRRGSRGRSSRRRSSRPTSPRAAQQAGAQRARRSRRRRGARRRPRGTSSASPSAIASVPSVEPFSTTMTSNGSSPARRPSTTSSTDVSRISASLNAGMTTLIEARGAASTPSLTRAADRGTAALRRRAVAYGPACSTIAVPHASNVPSAIAARASPSTTTSTGASASRDHSSYARSASRHSAVDRVRVLAQRRGRRRGRASPSASWTTGV